MEASGFFGSLRFFFGWRKMDLDFKADRVRFILADPSIPANIGAAARAIKTMGFRQLWVSNPRVKDYRHDPDAVRLSTQAEDVLSESRETASLAEALEGVRYAWALSGYNHEFGPKIYPLRTAAASSAALLSETAGDSAPGDIAFVFGTERDGLSNKEVMLCHAIAAIPADSEMPSLNLAQAVQVCAYEVREALRETEGKTSDLLPWELRFKAGEPASASDVAGFISHLEKALIHVGMTREGDHRKIMDRLRTIFSRASLTEDDVVLLRAVCAAVIRPRTQWQESVKEAGASEAPDTGRWHAGKDR